MKAPVTLANGVVAAALIFAAGAWPVWPAWADGKRLDDLFQQLQSATDEEAVGITGAILLEWSKSGSPAMDLLLRRGQMDLASGDPHAAVDHLTALIDHAPDFAEGYNMRATAEFQLGELGLSLGDIAHTLSLNPRHFGALTGLGRIFEELNEPDKALEVYREALKLNPHLKDVKGAVARLEAKLDGQEL